MKSTSMDDGLPLSVTDTLINSIRYIVSKMRTLNEDIRFKVQAHSLIPCDGLAWFRALNDRPTGLSLISRYELKQNGVCMVVRTDGTEGECLFFNYKGIMCH